MKRKKFRKILTIILPVVILALVLLYFFQTRFFDVIVQIIRSQGPVGYLVYVGYAVLSEVIPVLSAVVFKPVALVIYGYKVSVLLSFIGSTFGALINYWIAKKYGREIVKKIVGKDSLVKIDRFAKMAGWKAFLALRIIAVNFYDWVSYAAGLANIPLKMYVTITLPVNFIWQLISFYIFSKALDFSDWRSVVILFLSYLITLLGATIMWRKYSKVLDKDKNDD